jgi:hypothetical protein
VLQQGDVAEKSETTPLTQPEAGRSNFRAVDDPRRIAGLSPLVDRLQAAVRELCAGRKPGRVKPVHQLQAQG